MRPPRFLLPAVLVLTLLAACGTKTALTLPPQGQAPSDNSKASGPGR